MNCDASKADDTSNFPRLILIAYLLHLLVPLFLLLDGLRAIHADGAGVGLEEKAGVAIGAAWVLAGLGALAMVRDRRAFLHRISGPLTLIYAFCIALAPAELGTRAVIRRTNHATILFQPNTKMVFDLSPWHLPGTSPKATFTVNSLGLRGPLPPAGKRVYKIVAVGGSTTECGALDDSEAWPNVLMQALKARQSAIFVWVNNAGASGLTTVDHLSALRRLRVIQQADLLIFLIGINDLEAALEFGGAPTDDVLEQRAELFADHAPRGVMRSSGILRRSWLLAILRRAMSNLRSRFGNPESAAAEPQISEPSQARAAGPILPLPNLRVSLEEYTRRIRALEAECRMRNLRCVYLTQPSMWRPDLSPDEQHLLWLGKVGRKGKTIGYASAADLQRAMDAFNQSLLFVCRQDRLECYDLAAAIPKDSSAFYDDVHFNIGGARMVAEFLTDRLTGALAGGAGSAP